MVIIFARHAPLDTMSRWANQAQKYKRAAGKHSDGGGASTCKDCAAGKYSAAIGATSASSA